MTELDISRRSVFQANATGASNNYIPQRCRIDVMSQTEYPVSDWRMYPELQHTPYGAPIGPAPVEIRSSYQQLPPESQDGYGPRYDREQPHSRRQGHSFQLPTPDDLKDEE
jgi:hypothetical protein